MSSVSVSAAATVMVSELRVNKAVNNCEKYHKVGYSLSLQNVAVSLNFTLQKYHTESLAGPTALCKNSYCHEN